ncbi:50S ribosomal protein L9 [Candidatus Karelsulcia muelleri]
MKILLIKDVKELGMKYDIVEVNPGYAKNCLFTKQLAILFTDYVKNKYLNILNQNINKEKQLINYFNKQIIKINKLNLVFYKKASKSGFLSKTFSKKDLFKILKKNKININKINLKPINHVGIFNFEVKFSKKRLKQFNIRIKPNNEKP